MLSKKSQYDLFYETQYSYYIAFIVLGSYKMSQTLHPPASILKIHRDLNGVQAWIQSRWPQ